VSFFNIFVAQALLAEQTPTFITTHEERRYAYKDVPLSKPVDQYFL